MRNCKIRLLLSKVIKKLQIPSISNSHIAKKSYVGSKSNLLNVQLDSYSYVGCCCSIAYCKIGKFVSIADNCVIGGAKHPIDWLSTSPVFYDKKNVLKTNLSKNHFSPYEMTQIGNDVWIGANAIIKAGVRIGNGAIIGTGAVITKDVPSYEIWAGNPGHLLRKRFSDSIISQIEESEWWDYDIEQLKKCGLYANDPLIFVSKLMFKDHNNDSKT